MKARSVETREAKFIHFIYTGHSNWAVSFQIMDDDKVYVLDSLYNYFSVSMKMQMSQIYGKSRNTQNTHLNLTNNCLVVTAGSLSLQILKSNCFGGYDEIIKHRTIAWEFKQCEIMCRLANLSAKFAILTLSNKTQKWTAIKIMHVS